MGKITEIEGNIFDAPPNSILVHACSTKGVWGSGVALEFKKRFPTAFKEYKAHCAQYNTSKDPNAPILGTALIIPPPEQPSTSKRKNLPRVYIACLFTSKDYGRNVDKPKDILHNTRLALRDLKDQISRLEVEQGHKGLVLGGVRSVRINSGKFGVLWKDTKKVLEEEGIDMTVVRPEEQDEPPIKAKQGAKRDNKNAGIDNGSDHSVESDNEGGADKPYTKAHKSVGNAEEMTNICQSLIGVTKDTLNGDMQKDGLKTRRPVTKAVSNGDKQQHSLKTKRAASPQTRNQKRRRRRNELEKLNF